MTPEGQTIRAEARFKFETAKTIAGNEIDQDAYRQIILRKVPRMSVMSSRIICYSLTGLRFEELDFSEAVLCIDYQTLGSSKVTIDAWGILFHLRSFSLDSLLLPAELQGRDQSAYLPEWSRVSFRDVNRIEIAIAAYEPSFEPSGKLFLVSGEPYRIARSWGTGSAKETHEYRTDCVIEHPYGYGSVVIHASGEAELIFNPGELIPLSQYAACPLEHGWWGKGRLRGEKKGLGSS